MKQIASATALAVILAACSGQEIAAAPEADIASATPTASADDSAMDDLSVEDADAARNAMVRDAVTDGSSEDVDSATTGATTNASASSEVRAIPPAWPAIFA